MSTPKTPHAEPVLARRSFLGALAGGAAALVTTTFPRTARADVQSRIRSISRGERGATFYLELENAPFPAPGAGYKDPTVIVYVPSHFRYSPTEHLPVVVHFHGINGTAEGAMTSAQLREQLFDSRQNAILVVPQGPKNADDTSFGKLEQEGGLAAMLHEMTVLLHTREARRALGDAQVGHGAERAHVGVVCLSAHSGGYHGVAGCLLHGGLEVTEVYLFDALYSDTEVFRDWVIKGKGRSQRHRHKLVTYFGGGTTAAQSKLLRAQLEKAGVKCASEQHEGTLSRGDLTREEAIFVQTALAHGQVTWESNALRDCLFASALPRHLRSSWFHDKDSARPIDERQEKK